MAWLEYLISEFAPYWLAIMIGMGIGLSGAYAREFNDGKSPSKHWLRNRLLLYPFLALTAETFAEIFELTHTQAAFLAAILSLMAFDALRVIITRFEKKAIEAIDGIGTIIAPEVDPDELIALGKLKRLPKSDGDDPAP